MTDYTIANTFTLPSKGLVYSKKINPEVTLRAMTTAEEMKRLNHSDRSYKPLADVIDACIVNDIGISAYDLCIADYQFLMHKLRIVTYGTDYKTITKCPICLSENHHTLNLEKDLDLIEFDEDLYNRCSNIILPVTKKSIKIRMQSPRMIDDISLQVKEVKKHQKSNSQDPAFLITLYNLIETVDNNKYADFELEEFIQNLPMRDTNYILKAAQCLNTFFGLDSVIIENCDLCGLDYTTSFQVTSEFFGPSIDF